MRRVPVALLVTVFLGAANLPYLAALRGASEETVFLGVIGNVPDTSYVLAEIAEGSRSGVIEANPYGPPSGPRVYFHPIYAMLSILATIGMGSPLLLYHVARNGAMVLLVLLLWRWIEDLPRVERTIALTLALFGGGIGPVTSLTKQLIGLPKGLDAFTSEVDEASILRACTGFMHLAFSLSLIVAIHLLVLRAFRKGSSAAAILAAAAHLLLAFVHPFDAVGVTCVVAVNLVAEGGRNGNWSILLKRLIPVIAAPAPAAGYFAWLSIAHPGLANRSEFQQPSMAPLVMLSAVGVTIVIALPAALRYACSEDIRRRYMSIWLLVQLACSMARPIIPFDRRLLMGVSVPASILAAGLLSEQWRLGRWRRGLCVALMLAALVPTPVSVAMTCRRLLAGKGPEFMPAGLWAAAELLAESAAPGDIVLCPEEVGLQLPRLGNGRPLVGHWALSPRYEERRGLTRMFLRSRERKWRRDVLRREGIAWILQPDQDADLGSDPLLERVLDGRGAHLYKVLALGP